ncbi:P-loop containing nucleoside triphosphate hydrolase protein [Imleria badia]|nr:P-loop containing nucleoside triphosphate hydrolase protein [Imleria badia]
MDDQACRSHKKMDHMMVEAFGKHWGNHSSFKVGVIDRSGHPTFTVNHFNGPVTYSSEGFLERNLDSLNPDFISLLHGSMLGTTDGTEGAGSINPFPIKLMRTPSTRRKATVKQMAMLRKDGAVKEQDREEDDAPNASSGLMPCIAGEFRAALDTLFDMLSETQSWFIFCVNPNNSQLPNQLEGWSVKGQIRSLGLTEVSKRNVNVFEVGLTPEEFCARYKDLMAKLGVVDGSAKEKVEQTRNILGLQEIDMVLGQYKVFLSQAAFHSLEDRICALDAEAGIDVHSIGDPYTPYASPGLPPDDYADTFSQEASQAHVPLVANASPFQCGEFPNDNKYEDRKPFHSDNFDNRSRLTSNWEETNSNYGSESYAPSRNMFQNARLQYLGVVITFLFELPKQCLRRSPQ